MNEIAVPASPGPSLVQCANITAKISLLVMLAVAVAFPDFSHLRDKAAGLRAIGYPMLAFAVPLVWWLFWKERAFPWFADFLITLTCFNDILGNQLNLYDTIVWFDDWMHFMNTGLLAGAVVLLTMRRTASLMSVLERALAVGATSAIVWELLEFFAFLRFSPERRNGYVDTLGDLSLGTMGAVTAAVIIYLSWQLVGTTARTEHGFVADQPKY